MVGEGRMGSSFKGGRGGHRTFEYNFGWKGFFGRRKREWVVSYHMSDGI
jgi:hypothetical protein